MRRPRRKRSGGLLLCADDTARFYEACVGVWNVHYQSVVKVSLFSDEKPVEINGIDDLPDFDDVFLDVLADCGGASYGLGNNWSINWDTFYQCLEMEGWDMQDMDGPADNKIRRVVQKMVREGEIS
ncbi:hypothetical protein LCGC14_2325650 [marine sediment metagenome]|uniref:Uncharacterized protein n=1 Tax=marine sediment metagenome TaxID=412755 RepID=A0A0F9CGI4_9ZZZZ